MIRERTGLVPDPYFSATKLEWILARTELPARELAFGTIDSWLVWKLTAGGAHVTDVTNASRTMLLDLAAGTWDDELLALFGVDRAVLPDVVRSSGVIGEATLLGARVPIAGIAGDQQAALFGQGCFAPGEAKATYGTGTFVLVALGEHMGSPAEGLLTTAAAVPAEGRAAVRGRGRRARRRRGAAMAPRRSRRDRVGDGERAARDEAWNRPTASSSSRH